MSTTSVWTLFLVVGLGTFLLRLSFLGTVRGAMPPLLKRALRLVPAAVLTALVVPAAVPASMTTAADLAAPVALAASAVTARLSRSVLLTLAVGMIVLWVLG